MMGEYILNWVDANAGAPMSRRMTQPIRSSLLGNDDDFIRLPRILRVGIAFEEGMRPRQVITGLLEEIGCQSAEELRDLVHSPASRLLARPAPESFRPVKIG